MTKRRVTYEDNATTLPGRVTFPTGTVTQDPDWRDRIKQAGLAALNAFGAPAAPVMPKSKGDLGQKLEKLRAVSNLSAIVQTNVSMMVASPAYAMANFPDNPVQAYRDVAGLFARLRKPRAPRPPGALEIGPDLPLAFQGPSYAQAYQAPAPQPSIPTPAPPGAPFGTNALGQRLDAAGNVWDPRTATRDIYGGQFVQVGTVRWERNEAGKLVRVKHLGGGKRRILSGPQKGTTV